MGDSTNADAVALATTAAVAVVTNVVDPLSFGDNNNDEDDDDDNDNEDVDDCFIALTISSIGILSMLHQNQSYAPYQLEKF